MSVLNVSAQDALISKFNTLTDYYTSDAQKEVLSDDITSLLVAAVNADFGVIHNFSIPQLKSVSTNDSSLVILSWHYFLSGAVSQYGGLIVHNKKCISLIYNNSGYNLSKKYSADEWPGAVYYDIIPQKIDGATIYTLLAWDGNNGVSFKKMIDVLSFDRRGNPQFGMSMFTQGKATSHRVIFEYYARNTLLLDYDKTNDYIVTNSLYTHDNEPSYYAGEEFNIFRFQDEKWVLHENVDLRMDKGASNSLGNTLSTPRRGLH